MVKSKLVPAILIGAVAGAAISMLDKATREHTIETSKKMKDTVTYYTQNRDEFMQLLETKVEQFQSVYSSTQQNMGVVMTKIEDAKALPQTVMGLVAETKEAFSKKDADA
ncbi:YtxH domain-containing protein [Lysinibacillus sp. LZ02]|uniref:YtxH domain-containing protein n=1 Tax=Lysinibacillus sp. LZ02 TaxID=3420668 RepID=UPI003D36597D